jgi:hypothetical protein
MDYRIAALRLYVIGGDLPRLPASGLGASKTLEQHMAVEIA